MILILSPLIRCFLLHFLLQMKFCYCHYTQANKSKASLSFYHLQIFIEHILNTRHCSRFLGYSEQNRQVSLLEVRKALLKSTVNKCIIESFRRWCVLWNNRTRKRYMGMLAGVKVVILNRMVGEAMLKRDIWSEIILTLGRKEASDVSIFEKKYITLGNDLFCQFPW